MNLLNQSLSSLGVFGKTEAFDSGMATDPTSVAFQPIHVKAAPAAKAPKARKPAAAKPVAVKVEAPAAKPLTKSAVLADFDLWAANIAANIKAAGFKKTDLTIVEGKRAKLVADGKTITWFTKREYASAVVAAL